MPESVTLYSFKNDAIKITIEARFEKEALIVEGYDIGKQVEEFWGDSDYEYTTTVHPPNVPKLCKALKVPANDKQLLLDTLASRFNTNTCYSEFGKFLTDHHIASEGFSWV